MQPEDKKRMGMTNFSDEEAVDDSQDPMDTTEVRMPEDVFEEISRIYFNEVYLKFTDELKSVKDELKSVKKELVELKEAFKNDSGKSRQ